MRRFLYAVFITMGAIVLMFSVNPSTAGASEDMHCPDKDNPAKVEGSEAEASGDLVFEAGTEFCAKKGTGNTGVIVADGTTTLYEYLVAAGIDGAEGEGPSYYIVYTTEEPCDETDPESECYVPPCDVTDPQSECYEPPCDPTDPEGECYVPPCDPTDPNGECYIPPPPPPPVDVCPNIEGNQATVPAGMVKDNDGDCVLPPPPPPPVDLCPNIDGDQAEMPVWYVIDADGNCVTEPPAEPPVEEPPVVTPPAQPPVEQPPAVVNNTVRRTAQPVVEYELAETGSNNTMTLALAGFGLIMAGMVLTRKGQRI